MSRLATILSKPKASTLQDFVHGYPERVIGSTRSPSILIVWLHGDEPLGAHVAHHIFTERPDLADHVDYICGNPKAASSFPAKGFCETDLNRSFGVAHKPESYEEKRAAEIFELAKDYDYVLDIHNAVDPTQGRGLIIADTCVDTPKVRTMIAASPVKRVSVMRQSAINTTLVGLADNVLTIEYSLDASKEFGVHDVVDLIEHLVGQKIRRPIERDYYYIEGTIPKSQDPGPEAQNFVFWKTGSYYPILLGTGPRSYREDPTKDYCCFYAKRTKKVVL